MTSEIDYAGDISCQAAWGILNENPDAVLIDCRTDAEFSYVGVPDTTGLKNRVLNVSWKIFPDMKRNPHFEDAIRESVSNKDAPLLFLCRSGVRSKSAAIAMTALGYKHCYNIEEGFEGDKCPEGQRGKVGGWKVHGLPWSQP